MLAALLLPGPLLAAPPAASPQDGRESARRWVRHEVIPGDRLDTIAARYGVERSSVIRWNKLDPNKAVIRVGQKLRVYARSVPPARQLIAYEVRSGDTWQAIADAHGVDARLLRRWNKSVPRKFRAGTKLRLWVEPQPEPAGDGSLAEAEPLPLVSVPGGGESVGQPNRGRLVNGVQLPENEELYTRRDPELLYGTTHAIEHLQRAVALFRRTSGYAGRLVISAISRKSGGRFPPHSSHQSGRDVDIRLPVRSGVEGTRASDSSEVDWDASWALVRALIDTRQVEYIFLEYGRQRRLHAAARRAGVEEEQLQRWIQFPAKSRTNQGIVRHADGHTSHLHVRFACGPAEDRCVSY